MVRDLLWYADMTVGPDGQRMSFPARMAEVQRAIRARSLHRASDGVEMAAT